MEKKTPVTLHNTNWKPAVQHVTYMYFSTIEKYCWTSIGLNLIELNLDNIADNCRQQNIVQFCFHQD